jgi:hypothetical protein
MSIRAKRVFAVGVLCALGGSVPACSQGSPDENVSATSAPIVGGRLGQVGQFPNVVALVMTGPNGQSLCTGTLVAPNVVVTAAHCVLPEEVGVATQAEVTAGTRVLFDRASLNAGGGTIVAAASTLPQPAFDINNLGQHDIGIVVLSQRVTSRAPAPIVRDAAQVRPGALVTLVGYGISRINADGTADNTSAGTENVLENKGTVPCASIGGSDANLICFDQSDGKGSCNGDSGGPAFSVTGGTNTVAGVTSFGDQNCVQIGAYTRLTAEIAFFDQQMLAAGACAADGVCTPACGAGGLPADPDCGSSTPPPNNNPPPSTTPPTNNDPGSNPGTNDPEIGDPPGLTGGCSFVGVGGGSGGGETNAAGILLLSFALTSVTIAARGRRRRARAGAQR